MATDLDEALGTEGSLKATKKATKKPSKGVTLKGAAAKAKLRANGDRKTKVAGIDEPTDKPKKKKLVKKKKAASNRGVRNGSFTEAVDEATTILKRLKKGTTFTTREVKDKWPDGPKGWAFRVAANRLVEDKIVKVKNVDRVNTITRL
jgi:hypothetical protein